MIDPKINVQIALVATKLTQNKVSHLLLALRELSPLVYLLSRGLDLRKLVTPALDGKAIGAEVNAYLPLAFG